MKINKYILGLAVAVMGGFSSCNTDVEGSIYNSDLEHVSFDGASTSVSVSVDETSATIPVTINRGVVANASTITFKAVASKEGIFSNDANGTVTFAPGQNTATFNVKAANLEKDQSYTYTLSLSDAAIATADTITGVKQNKVYTIKVSRAGDWTEWEPWNDAKTASYYFGVYPMSGTQTDLEFYHRQNTNDPTKEQFMLKKWAGGADLILDYNPETGVVYVPESFTGYVTSYGELYITDATNYFPTAGLQGSFDKEKGIITLAVLYTDVDGPWTEEGGYEYVYIDGYVRADYTMTIAYFGRLTDAEDNNFLLADISFGKDVEYVKYALVTAEEVDATIAGLADGSIAGEKLTESGRVQFPVAESGTYYLVAVAFAGGKAVNAEAAKIKFSTGGEPEETWTPKYIGKYAYTTADYTESQAGGLWEGTIDAILYQSDSDASRWKIAPWADLTGEEGLVFTMDNEGVLTVDQVYTGYTHSTYGDVFATDILTAGVADMPSYCDGTNFFFNLMYHDAEEAWTFVQDTFTLTGAYEASSRSAKAISKAKRSSHKITVKRGCQLARQYFAPIKKSKNTLMKK